MQALLDIVIIKQASFCTVPRICVILACRGGQESRRSGQHNVMRDLDVMRGWGQSVSLGVWHKDSRFHFHANLTCLFLNQTWPSRADNSRGLRSLDVFCLKPETHKLKYGIAWSMHNRKTIPLFANAITFAHTHAVISTHMQTHACMCRDMRTHSMKPVEKALALFTVKEWYKGLTWDQIVFREPTLRADGSVFHLSSHEI